MIDRSGYHILFKSHWNTKLDRVKLRPFERLCSRCGMRTFHQGQICYKCLQLGHNVKKWLRLCRYCNKWKKTPFRNSKVCEECKEGHWFNANGVRWTKQKYLEGVKQ